MTTTEIIFSPTGGTAEIAEILTKAIGFPSSKIDLSSNAIASTNLSSDTLAVIAVPSFSGRVPSTAAERLKSKVRGNGTKAVLTVVYGNRAYEDTIIELYDIAAECGFNVIACVSAVAKHSIVTHIASNRPDETDRDMLNDFGKLISEKATSDNSAEPVIPGNRPYRKVGTPSVPKTDSMCNRCGACTAMCPVGAINPAEPSDVNEELCIGCMRCVSLCPISSKFIPEEIVSAIDFKIKDYCADRKDPELFL